MHIKICEVGPRDGLQNHVKRVDTADKITMVDTLSTCGFYSIEVTSFVSPKWVPKLADAAEVMAGIARPSDTKHARTKYIVLIPNVIGFERAVVHNPDGVVIFPACSEHFCNRNLNAPKPQVFDRFATVAKRAHAHHIPIKGSLSCAGYCPYAGDIAPCVVADDVQRLLDMGCSEIGLADTVGKVTADMSKSVLDRVLKYVPAEKLSGHFHDTDNLALDNVGVYIQAGVTLFDSAVLGLGGCPFAKGAKGNLNTRKLLQYLSDNGHTTDVCLDTLAAAETHIRAFV